MRRILTILFATIITSTCAAQLTIEQCYALARSNYPDIKRYALIGLTRDFTVQNAAKGYLPNVQISGGAAAFTDIIGFPSQQQANFGDTQNYALGVVAQINQTIYDGGTIAAKKRVAEAQANLDTQRLEVSMYQIRKRINQLYFGVLILDKQIEQNQLLQKDLKLSENAVQAMINGGIANQTDLDVVKVEQLKAKQQADNLRSARQSYAKILGTFIDKDIDENTVLQMPENTTYIADYLSMRPELYSFTAQEQLINAQRKLLDASLMPKISAFGLATYHTKPMGFVKNGQLMVGITLSWNIAPLYTRKNDLQLLDLRQQDIMAQAETFRFNSNMQTDSYLGKIDNLKRQIKQDIEIVTLRENIYSKSMKKVAAGTETVNDMLRELNAKNEARLQKELHEIQFIQQIYNLKYANNN